MSNDPTEPRTVAEAEAEIRRQAKRRPNPDGAPNETGPYPENYPNDQQAADPSGLTYGESKVAVEHLEDIAGKEKYPMGRDVPAPGFGPTGREDRFQRIYDEAHELGILVEPIVAREAIADGVLAVRIDAEAGQLIESFERVTTRPQG
jgi:hypothetical protein